MYDPVRTMAGFRWASAMPERSLAERTDLRLWNCFGLEAAVASGYPELVPDAELSPISNLATGMPDGGVVPLVLVLLDGCWFGEVDPPDVGEVLPPPPMALPG